MNFIDDAHGQRFVEIIEKAGKRCDQRISGQYAAAMSILSIEAIYPYSVNNISEDGIDFSAIKRSPLSEADSYMAAIAENLFTGRGAVNLDNVAILDSENFVTVLRALQFRKNGIGYESETENGLEVLE